MYIKNLQDQTPVFDDGYTKLGNAIIMQAVKDYRDALKGLIKNPYSKSAICVKTEVERFFRSDWFSSLTGVDGEMLIKKLSAEVQL